MSKLVFSLLGFIILGFTLLGQNNQVSIELLKDHVYTLASDSLQGRATGTIGQRKAADYIISNFKEYSLSKTSNNTYKHYYNLIRKHNNSITVKSNNTILFSPWHFHFTSGFNQNQCINAKLIFAGYGTNSELDKLTLTNNAVAFISYSPQAAYKTIKRIKAQYNTQNYFVIIPDKNKDIEHAWNTSYMLSKYNLPYVFKRNSSLKITEDRNSPNDSINIFYCSNNALKNLLNKSDIELIKLAEDNKNTDSIIIAQSNMECTINFNDSTEIIKVENIAGMVYGKNRNQTIIISAHYDHLGIEMGEIYYGADDNASGTSVLLELARLISQQNKTKPFERSILFVGFSGEELGLFGSEAFVNSPLVNLDSIVLNINMDMVGRWDKKHSKKHSYVYLLNAGPGSKKYFSLGKNKLNLPKYFKVSKNPGSYEKEVFKRGSDHYSFYQKEVPISVIFTGLHDDYHTPEDTPNKINYDNMSNITKMLFQYICEIANNPKDYPVRFKK